MSCIIEPEVMSSMSLSHEDYLEGSKSILRDSQNEKEKYYVKILDKRFVVYPNVFSPKYFKDSEFFYKELTVREGEVFLEIGPGTGIISVLAALKGASRVVAVDINEDAVENTKENARINGVGDKVEVFQGDVYGSLPDDVKFDTIFWNVPFGHTNDEGLTALEKSIQDPAYRSIRKFVFEAKKHLKSEGRLVIGFSTTLGKFDVLRDFLKEAGFDVKMLAEVDSVEVHPAKFEIFEAVFPSS